MWLDYLVSFKSVSQLLLSLNPISLPKSTGRRAHARYAPQPVDVFAVVFNKVPHLNIFAVSLTEVQRIPELSGIFQLSLCFSEIGL